jgi:hypothetical protein
MECPFSDVDNLYTILKVMKKNRSIFQLLRSVLLLVKNPSPNATPQMKQRLASAVNFHTLFQMSINHVALRGLVDSDKLVHVGGDVDILAGITKLGEQVAGNTKLK